MLSGNRPLLLGAILTMFAAYFGVVESDDVISGVLFFISDCFLFCYAYNIVAEYFRKVLNPSEENCTD